jgi:hypothetical protein
MKHNEFYKKQIWLGYFGLSAHLQKSFFYVNIKFIENIKSLKKLPHVTQASVFGNIFCESMPEASNVFTSITISFIYAT